MSAGETETLHVTRDVLEQSLWIGASAKPIFARLATPVTSSSVGGLLISPPIGRESRTARQALRALALSLAVEGFAVLRYDHFGTSDSSGDFDDDVFYTEWTDQIRRGVDLLRSIGAPSVSALGMRLGATILGSAANLHDLELSSVVLWDPCESGRSYLRERAAFEAVIQEDDRPESTSVNQRSEFVYRDETKEKMRSLTLLEVEPERLAKRILIITRDDRVTPIKLTRQFDTVAVQWESTDEQSALMEAELPTAKLPDVAIRRIRDWIVESKVDETPLLATPDVTASLVGEGPGPMAVRERAISVGPQGLFVIVSEPVGEANGPWIVLVNGGNEDHVGPSRLWVDLSRRWSSFGLRCARFDFIGRGESPEVSSSPPTKEFDEPGLGEIYDVLLGLSPEDPSNAVLIGLCSGAHRALQAALQLQLRGVCTINPQVGPASLRNRVQVEMSERSWIRSKLVIFVEARPWMGKLVRQMCRVALPSAYSLRVRKALADQGTEMLLVASPQDLIPFPRTPILRSLDKRRLISSANCRVEVLPSMDHDLLNSEGRRQAVAIVDDHVLNKFSS
jgi:pimeloyl-ACP methyl ester carboxylesterase